jgi:hypothetical protein
VRRALLILAGAAGVSAPAAAAPGALDWRPLQPGLEYAVVTPPGPRSFAIDDAVHVVRIDPSRARLEAVMAGAGDRRPRPAGQWCRERGLAAAINLGMYREDNRTNSGYARDGAYVNNPRWAEKYKAALAFGPTRPSAPPAFMADLDEPGDRARLADYRTVVQNLRLIRGGQGMWTAQPRRWSEAAVAVDERGRVLFVFSRYPRSMKDFNDLLLSLPLGVVAAMHVEGGPEASLSIHAGGVNLDLHGSYETGFNENDAESRQWPIPNVLGVRRR